MHSNYSLRISCYSQAEDVGGEDWRQVGLSGSQPPIMIREPEGVMMSFGRGDWVDRMS